MPASSCRGRLFAVPAERVRFMSRAVGNDAPAARRREAEFGKPQAELRAHRGRHLETIKPVLDDLAVEIAEVPQRELIDDG